MPLVPGIRNAMQEDDRLARSGLRVVPCQILRIPRCGDKMMGKGNAVDDFSIAILIVLSLLNMDKTLSAFFNASLVRNESLDRLPATLRYFGILMRTLQNFN